MSQAGHYDGRRRGLIALLVIIVLLAGGYYGFLRFAQSHLEGLLAAEARHGRHWSCASLDVSGPFPTFLYQCGDARLNGGPDASSPGLAASVRSVTMGWSLLEPSHARFEAAAPLSGTWADQPFKADWQGLSATIDGYSSLSARAQIQAEQIVAQMGGAVPAVYSAAHLRVEAGPVLESQQLQAWPVSVHADGLVSPIIARILRNDTPLAVDFRAHMSLPPRFDGSDISEIMERWRQAGGVIQIEELHLVATDLNIMAAGTLALDDQHRLSGALDLNINGGQDLLSHYGYIPKGGLVGSLLGGLLKGTGRGIALPLRFSDGRVWLGPLKLPLQLVALY